MISYPMYGDHWDYQSGIHTAFGSMASSKGSTEGTDNIPPGPSSKFREQGSVQSSGGGRKYYGIV